MAAYHVPKGIDLDRMPGYRAGGLNNVRALLKSERGERQIMISRIKSWYSGQEKLVEFENDPRSSIVIMPSVHIEYHWSAKIVRAVATFYMKHWQWVWTTAIAVVAVYVAIRALK